MQQPIMSTYVMIALVAQSTAVLTRSFQTYNYMTLVYTCYAPL